MPDKQRVLVLQHIEEIISSALRASSGCECEKEGNDGVAALLLTLTKRKPSKAAWKENGPPCF